MEGVVRYGIRVGQLETHTVGDELTILYPAPMPLAIDLKKHLYFPETMDRDQYNAALLEAKPRLVKQALKEGILEEAEQRLQTELPALARELAPGAKVVLRKKGPMP